MKAYVIMAEDTRYATGKRVKPCFTYSGWLTDVRKIVDKLNKVARHNNYYYEIVSVWPNPQAKNSPWGQR